MGVDFEILEILEVKNMDVGERIRRYIDSINMSQVELSKRTKIAPAKLNLSLSGKRKMTFQEYQTICWALGVGVDAFMEPREPVGN